MAKTIGEINEKIQEGKAVVVTAEEIIDIAKQKGIEKTAQEVDVVTTGTFRGVEPPIVSIVVV